MKESIARGNRVFFVNTGRFLFLRVRKDKGFQKNIKLNSGVWHFFDLELDFQILDFDSRISTGIRPRCPKFEIWPRIRIQKTCQIFSAFVFYLVFLNFDFVPIAFIFNNRD